MSLNDSQSQKEGFQKKVIRVLGSEYSEVSEYPNEKYPSIQIKNPQKCIIVQKVEIKQKGNALLC